MPVTDESLIAHYRNIHKQKRYGQNVHDFLTHIKVCLLDIKPNSVLEYGCGQSQLYRHFDNTDIQWHRYDPSIEEISNIEIDKVDMCINTDVLEHIPENDVDDVLKHICSFSDKVFFTISTRPARQILENGENAHCTVWSAQTWLFRIKKFFPNSMLVSNRYNEQCIIVTWQSPTVDILKEIEDLYIQTKRVKKDHVFKKAERKLRKIRDNIKGMFKGK